jgi:hypothetical protein
MTAAISGDHDDDLGNDGGDLGGPWGRSRGTTAAISGDDSGDVREDGGERVGHRR